MRSLFGEMSEWSKEHAWKVCIWETVSRVRIPLSPPENAWPKAAKKRKRANQIYLNSLSFFFLLNPRSGLGIFRSHPPLGIIALAIIPFKNVNSFEFALFSFFAQSTEWIRHFPKPSPPGIIASAIIPIENVNLFELALLLFMAQSTEWIRHFPKPPPLGIIA